MTSTPNIGSPVPWGMGLQTPGSPLSALVVRFHDSMLWLLVAISVFVLALLIVVVWRFRAKRNPNPSKTTHNLPLEIVWTVIPVVILAVLWFPSMGLIWYAGQIPPDAALTLKVTGHQWYWSYEYPDNGGIAFDSRPLWDSSDTKDEQALALVAEYSPNWLLKNEAPQRLLEVDNRVVLPIGVPIRVQITAGDVLHSWLVPSLGVNKMAVTGRLNEVWLRIDHEGVYRGQCSMICGTGHAYMPIVIEGVSRETFDNWVKSKKPPT